MDQIRKIEIFRQEAGYRLPGFLYSFNIADLKRRNAHLGFRTGDKDIEDLERLLKPMESDSVLVARTKSNRWLMLTSRDEKDRVQSLLDQYKRTQLFAAGWEVRATKSGQEKHCRESVSAEIQRAIRCLYALVKTRDELAAAIQQVDQYDWSLPVNRPLAMSEIPAMARENWPCVSQYPTHSPECPFCGGVDFEWEDGDDAVYSGDGACKGCGARITISDISQLSGATLPMSVG